MFSVESVDTQSRYAQIEKEALALTWACERSWEYITGKSIIVEADHKPFGPTVEHALTGPTPTKNPEIQDEADEVPLQRSQSRPWEKDVHR